MSERAGVGERHHAVPVPLKHGKRKTHVEEANREVALFLASAVLAVSIAALVALTTVHLSADPTAPPLQMGRRPGVFERAVLDGTLLVAATVAAACWCLWRQFGTRVRNGMYAVAVLDATVAVLDVFGGFG